MDLVVRVNGVPIRGFGPGDQGTIAASDLGPLAWTLEVVTSSGRRATSMDVVAGSSGCSAPGGRPERGCRGGLTITDSSCGRVVMAHDRENPRDPAVVAGLTAPSSGSRRKRDGVPLTQRG